MGLSLGKTWELGNNFEVCFKPRRMQCVGRKHRPIDPPYPGPKKLLRRLHRWLQSQEWHHPMAHGGIRRRSCFTSANVHLGQPNVWTRDASSCYPSISPDMFVRMLWKLGFRYDTAKLLTLLCTMRGQIPQGSPVSGDALNLFFWEMDQAISSRAGNQAIKPSQVADDIVLSGKNIESGEMLINVVEAELTKLGIKINQRKKQKAGFQDASKDRLVHGISTSKRRGTCINSKQTTFARQLAESYLVSCKSVSAESFEALANKRRSLVGWMHYCRQAHFSPAKHIRRLLEAGDRKISEKLLSLAITANKNKWWIVTRKRNEPRRIANVWQRRTAATAAH
ncbi:MAG: reverse transcriptase domain-containing protein [Pirellulales bacterium]